MLKYLSGAAVALTLTAGSAFAAVVYDNPYFAGASGNETTKWVQASSFSLGAATGVTGGTVAIAGFGDISAWDGAFDYWVFSDAAGPAGILASGAAAVNSVTDTGTAWGSGGNIWSVDFDLAGTFAASAATDYWLGIHLSTDFNRDEIYWVQSTNQNGTSESDGGTFNNWRNYTPARAFTLNDDPLAPIPVPAAGFLLVGALGGLAMTRRRRKS